MAIDRLQEYINSIDELKKAYSKVQKYGAIIGEVAKYLNKFPYKMTVSNVQVSFIRSGEREYILNGDNWPSAKQLAEVLSDYIQKRNKAETLHQSLPDTQRDSVKPPPEI